MADAESVWPGVVEIQCERQPPDQIVGQAERYRSHRPVTRGDQDCEADGASDFADEADRRYAPTLLRRAGDIPVEQAIKPDHHREAGEDFGVVRIGHVREAEEPLRIDNREDAPADVVGPGQAEDDAMKPAATDHTPSVFDVFLAPTWRGQGQLPPGRPRLA